MKTTRNRLAILEAAFIERLRREEEDNWQKHRRVNWRYRLILSTKG